MDETTVAKAKDPVDATRDIVQERAGKLTEKSAKKLFELPYEQRGRLGDFDEETRELIFETAVNEAKDPKTGKLLWGSAFNSYAALLELVKVVRTPGEFKESSSGQYAEQVFNAPNRVGAVFAILRKHKDMGAEDARNLLELAHSTALIGLSTDARKAVFAYAADRGVSWLEVANIYSELADIIARVKRQLYPEL